MNNRCLQIAVLVIAAVMPMATIGIAGESSGGDGGWWNVPYPQTFDASSLEMTLDTLRVEGNRFVDEQAEPVILRGVSIADPDKLERQGQWKKEGHKHDNDIK